MHLENTSQISIWIPAAVAGADERRLAHGWWAVSAEKRRALLARADHLPCLARPARLLAVQAVRAPTLLGMLAIGNTARAYLVSPRNAVEGTAEDFIRGA